MTERLLQRLYTQPQFGVAYQSVDKIYRKAREFDDSITKKTVDDFVRGKSSYSIFAQKKNKFRQRKIFSLSAGSHLSVDLLELSSQEKKSNRPYSYLYLQVDIFSSFLNLFPLKHKNIQEILLAMKKSFEFISPDSILCDRESAIFSHEIRNFLHEKNIHLITQQSASKLRWKNGPAENCVRQIKRIIHRFCEENHITRFVPYLKQISNIYNSHVNRRTGQTPKVLRWNKDAIAKYQEQLISSLEASTKERDKTKSPLRLGNLVHVRELDGSIFTKEGEKRFSKKAYMIVGVKRSYPIVYRLFPEIKGQKRWHYREELFLLPENYSEKNKFLAPLERILDKKQLRRDSASFRLAAELPQICRSSASYLTVVVAAASKGR